MHGTSTLAIIVIAVLCVATTAHAYQGPDLHAVTPSLPADWTAHDLSQRRVALADRSNDPSANTLRALGSSISGSSAGLVTELRFLGEAPRVVVIDANGVASYVDSSGNTGSSSEPVSVPGPPPGAIASSSTGATLDTVSDPPSPVSEPVETKPVETKPVEAESVEPSPPPNDNPVEPTPSPSPPPLPPTALNATIERERSTTITVEPTIFCTEDAAFDNSSCPGPETIAAQISVLNDVFNKYDFAFKLGETRYVRNDTVAGERFLEPAYELTALGMEWISSNHRGDRSSMNLMIKERGIGGKEDSTLGVTLQRGDDLEKSPKWLDSIVLRSGTLPGMTTYSGTYDQGGVLVHEVGHWLGLRHIFTDNCSDSDIVFGIPDDTPAITNIHYDCDAEAKADNDCLADDSESDADAQEQLVHNYMSYAVDSCREGFTPGQVKMMHFVFETYRVSK